VTDITYVTFITYVTDITYVTVITYVIDITKTSSVFFSFVGFIYISTQMCRKKTYYKSEQVGCTFLMGVNK
jgi:hypothetical protein